MKLPICFLARTFEPLCALMHCYINVFMLILPAVCSVEGSAGKLGCYSEGVKDFFLGRRTAALFACLGGTISPARRSRSPVRSSSARRISYALVAFLRPGGGSAQT